MPPGRWSIRRRPSRPGHQADRPGVGRAAGGAALLRGEAESGRQRSRAAARGREVEDPHDAGLAARARRRCSRRAASRRRCAAPGARRSRSAARRRRRSPTGRRRPAPGRRTVSHAPCAAPAGQAGRSAARRRGRRRDRARPRRPPSPASWAGDHPRALMGSGSVAVAARLRRAVDGGLGVSTRYVRRAAAGCGERRRIRVGGARTAGERPFDRPRLVRSAAPVSRVVVITGPSGVGKGTLIRLPARAACPSSGSACRRPRATPRPGEEDGVDYHFLSDAEFDRLVARGRVRRARRVRRPPVRDAALRARAPHRRRRARRARDRGPGRAPDPRRDARGAARLHRAAVARGAARAPRRARDRRAPT